MLQTIRSIVLTGLWITAAEFIRNEFLLQKLWVDHFSSLGLGFAPNPLVNGPLWMVWSFLLGGIIWKMSASMKIVPLALTAWIAAFPMMWIPLFNLQVLPLATLFYAVPLSIFEVLIAAWICRKSMGLPKQE